MPLAVLDTSAWIALLAGEARAARALETTRTHSLVTTPVVLAEIAAAQKRGRVRGNPVAAIEEIARVEPLVREDGLLAGELYARLRSRKRRGGGNVGLGDCLIYATARRIGAELITADFDLKDEPSVVVI